MMLSFYFFLQRKCNYTPCCKRLVYYRTRCIFSTRVFHLRKCSSKPVCSQIIGTPEPCSLAYLHQLIRLLHKLLYKVEHSASVLILHGVFTNNKEIIIRIDLLSDYWSIKYWETLNVFGHGTFTTVLYRMIHNRCKLC